MNWILSAENIHTGNRHAVGGKGYAPSLLIKGGFRIPMTICVTSDAYHEYVTKSGLRERILLELHRKEFKEMRWEEKWDCATRIRSMFLTTDSSRQTSDRLFAVTRRSFHQEQTEPTYGNRYKTRLQKIRHNAS